MAGVYTGKTAGGVMGGSIVLTRREGNQLQRGGPAGNIVAQPFAIVGLNRRTETTVEKLFRFLMGKSQLLAADLQQLIAHAQVGDAQLRQITRQHHQRHIFRLMAEEETHRIMNNRIGDQMIIINHQE